MRPEDKQEYLDMSARVFVRALRDTQNVNTAEIEFDLSEGEATDLLLRRERPAWQPIDTAPKDATKILVCGPGKDGIHYMDVTAWPVGWDLKWPTAYMAYAADEPTHWQPLPSPPSHPVLSSMKEMKT